MSPDFLITYTLMGLLFVRQIAVFKQPNKINYAPLLLGVGAIGSMSHFLLRPENENFLLLLRESMLPLFAGLMLFIVMNILQQARQHRFTQTQQEYTQKLIGQVEVMQEYIGKLEANQDLISTKEDLNRETLQEVFSEERHVLETIRKKQHEFMDAIASLVKRQEEVFERLETFTHQEVPSLDDVVHRHIDMLRIAEQDHFNRLQKTIGSLSKEQTGNAAAIFADTVREALVTLEEAQKRNIQTASEQFGRELGIVAKELQERFGSLRMQAESFSMSLSEDEKLLRDLRVQSELIMKQLTLTAESMDDIVEESERVRQLYRPLENLVGEVEKVHSDYVKAKIKLDMLTTSLQSMDELQIEKMREHIEALSRDLSERIDASLEKLHEHYHIAQKDISQTVKELSSRAKLKDTYQ